MEIDPKELIRFIQEDFVSPTIIELVYEQIIETLNNEVTNKEYKKKKIMNDLMIAFYVGIGIGIKLKLDPNYKHWEDL